MVDDGLCEQRYWNLGRRVLQKIGLMDWNSPLFKSKGSLQLDLEWAGRRCQSYWGRNGVTCAVCMTACPWSKPDNWVHRLARPFAAKGGQAAARVLVSMERVFYGKYTKAPDPSWAK